MPALSPTMETGKIVSWSVKVGDELGPGDLLADVETDKSTIGWEIQNDGFVAKILAENVGEDVPVGQGCLVIVDDEADIEEIMKMNFDEISGVDSKPKPALVDKIESKRENFSSTSKGVSEEQTVNNVPQQTEKFDLKGRNDFQIIQENWNEIH